MDHVQLKDSISFAYAKRHSIAAKGDQHLAVADGSLRGPDWWDDRRGDLHPMQQVPLLIMIQRICIYPINLFFGILK